MRRETVNAVMIKTHRGDDCRGYYPCDDWEDFDEALQRLPGEPPAADVPGLLDFEDGYAVFEASSQFGQRALRTGGCRGIAIEGDLQFYDEDDKVAEEYRAKYLRKAGANPELYDLSEAIYFYEYTFFREKRQK